MTRQVERWLTSGAGAPSGWTQRWVTANTTLNVTTDNVFEFSLTSSSQRSAIAFDVLNTQNDVELLCTFNTVGLTWTNDGAGSISTIGLFARGSGATASETMYTAMLQTSNGSTPSLNLLRYSSGTPTSITSATLTSLGISNNHLNNGTPISMRFSVVGTALKVKVWMPTIEAEPGSWDINTTDANIASGSWNGINAWKVSAGQKFRAFYADDAGATVDFDKVTGVIKDENNTVSARNVKLQHRNTQQTSLMSSTTSSGVDGTYTIYTPYGGEHNLIVYDDATTDPLFNDIINRVMPQ